jgi:hypothetical protein
VTAGGDKQVGRSLFRINRLLGIAVIPEENRQAVDDICLLSPPGCCAPEGLWER